MPKMRANFAPTNRNSVLYHLFISSNFYFSRSDVFYHAKK
jgi:hypothetical protein